MLVDNNRRPVLAAKMRELNPKQKREFEITGLQNESLTRKNGVVNTQKREYKYQVPLFDSYQVPLWEGVTNLRINYFLYPYPYLIGILNLNKNGWKMTSFKGYRRNLIPLSDIQMR